MIDGDNIALIAAISRAFSNAVAALSGPLCIWLGYRLYLAGISSETSGEFDAGSFKGSLKALGPGIFLAIFGAAIIVRLIAQPVVIETNEPVGPANATAGSAFALIAPANAAPVQDSATVKCPPPQDNRRRLRIQFLDGDPLEKARLLKSLAVADATMAREMRADSTTSERRLELREARKSIAALIEESRR